MPRPRAPHFDPQGYLQLYPDVARAGVDPLRHYLRKGRFEGRQPGFVSADLRARDLAMGLLEGGSGALEEMARGHPRLTERVAAACAAADRAAARGDWRHAYDLLRPLETERDIVEGFGLPDTALLAAEAALVCGHLARAGRILALARRRYGALPDLALARANLALAKRGAAAWRGCLALPFLRRGVLPPSLFHDDAGGSETARFDTLAAHAPVRRGILSGPLVSVLMPARNAAGTIATALRSLSAQSWQRLEILVIDNGSTDATAAVVARHAQADPRIRLIDGAAEPGAYGARNLGLAEARGDVITLLDADDWAHPARIARQLGALGHGPASLSSWVRATPDLRISRWWKGEGLVHPNISSLMIHRAAVETLGYWDRARAGADSEYLDRLRARFGAAAVVHILPELPLSFGRKSDTSLTGGEQTGVATLHHGPRRSYAEAAARWHDRMAPDQPLPQRPTCRPFDMPAPLAVGDPPPADPPDTERLLRAGHFDADWYLRSYPDLRRTGEDPLRHYLEKGAAEGRDPQARFSTSGYARAHGIPPAEALLHWQAAGAPQDGTPLPTFAGDLPDGPGPRPLFFGHQARAEIFGAERSLLDMLDRAREAGCLPSVVVPQGLNEEYLDALRARARNVYIRPYTWLFGGVAPPSETVEVLREVIRDARADAVHVNTGVLEAPARAARAEAVPVTLHLRELPASDPQLCHGLGLHPEDLRTLLQSLGDRFVANSQAVADWLEAPAERTDIVHNSVDSALFDLPFDPPPRPRVALVGSLTARKGVGDLVALARAAHSEGLVADFVTIGPQSADLAALAPLPENLRHAGYAPDALRAMARADIVLSLSHVAESFGRTVLEAMAAGRPVICYDRGTPPDLVGRDGTAGRVVAPDAPRALLEALREMLARTRLVAASDAARTRARALQDQAHDAARALYRQS
ncbi:glycosyltransferase [Sulfitobacter sp. HNIBRBA3233]|uniref:glycosyltransferase n=1 Tax=Sulfitobacter marinivivus TaxID=3158558 RepID=UPI0032DEE673